MPTRIAVDAMGGDDAPDVVVAGAVRALREAETPLEVLLFGPEAQIRALVEPHGEVEGLSIHDAPDVIEMGESPTSAVKRKTESSIHRGLGAVKAGHADAFVSAGNTGAVMAASLFILGRVDGVQRPTILGTFPTTEGSCLVVDVGSNVDCKPEHLLQFGQMGRVYAERVLGRTNPSVALMNVGEEPGKGNELAKAAYDLMSEQNGLGFRGNIEGRDLLHHAADVIVCDGFVGNIILKLAESIVTALGPMLRQEIGRQGLGDEAAQTVGAVFKGVQRGFDYQEQGGAPLLGVNGTVMIGHGSSTEKAVARMIVAGAEAARHDIPAAIAEVLGA